jgi:hypothetical protein
MTFFKLDKLGTRPDEGEPKLLDVRIHAGVNFDDAFESAKEIIRTSETEGVGGFRLTNSAGHCRVWFFEDDGRVAGWFGSSCSNIMN